MPLKSKIGTNLAPVTPQSTEFAFADAMKSASVWQAKDPLTAPPFDLDENGWIKALPVGEVATTVMLHGSGRYPAGRYVLSYEGRGTLLVSGATVALQTPGQMQLDVVPQNSGIQLKITATNPDDYLRNIAVLMPDTDGIFYAPFPDRSQSYSVLRFMEWMLGNRGASPQAKWADRPQVAHRTWATQNGVPAEIMVELANRLDAHPWFCVPHQADDDYVQNLAELVAGRLNPDLCIYVEHSNEVWNRQFAEYAYAALKGKRLGIDAMQYHALRTRQIGEIFKGWLGTDRVITVLGAQASLTWTASHGIEYLRDCFDGDHQIDAVAIAPYFGVAASPATADAIKAMSMDELFAYVRALLPSQVTDRTSAYRALADAYGLSLIAYEGGQHMVGIQGAEHDIALTAQFKAFNRDPRIGQLYRDYLDLWKAAGGELFCHYDDSANPGIFGSWGALEYIDQPSAPKFDALQTFIKQNIVNRRVGPAERREAAA
jgi:hypothetical protein